MDLATIRSRIAQHGLSYRGAFHPVAGEAPGETLVLVGFIGSENWPTFAASPEAKDGRPDPLDRWSTRVITEVAGLLRAIPLFPFEGPPFLPFQRWAQQAEPVHPSPLGILIHPDWGLWHAYRGALAFAERIDLPEPDRRRSPCDSCREKPCITACPVNAFTPAGFDVPACVAYISTPAGAACVAIGCQARRACPVGPQCRHIPEQAEFHQRSFRAAQR
ncbi:MAG TPA: hypothetical protein VH722_05435 [Alphaproteobacteria bacterium]|jgi:hypothetical protein|nr:hypothetical protein [Alphaproteobacteria bacterium]